MSSTRPKNVVALDVGSVRIGIAGSDQLGFTAQPIETLTRGRIADDLTHITDIAKKRGAAAFVVGLPLNMDGSKGQQALDTEAFVEKLKAVTDLPCLFVDERLTTRSAHAVLTEGGLRGKARKKVVDKLAAVFILETYLQSV